ncbi:hypothetical protein EDB19DRAFT_1921045 [Suillus lakei]|nr:hypothetical protein EDB19DRAFT_1921045 [Suillus lakei]
MHVNGGVLGRLVPIYSRPQLNSLTQIYDYVCSLQEEWKFLRQSHWSKVKGLYIIARYIPFFFVITDLFVNFAPNENPKKCRILVSIYSSCGVISLTCSECFFVLRTYALWNSNRIVLVAMLSTLFATIVAFSGICFSAIATSHVTTSAVPGITGCYRSSTSFQFFMPFVLLFVFQLGLVTLTLIRVVQSWRSAKGHLHAVLSSSVMAIVSQVLSAVNVLAPVLFSDPAYYSLLEDLQAFILAILATRMHLNLWHIDRHVHGSEILVCISMSDMSSADRTV